MPPLAFSRLTVPTPEVVDALTRWENDPALIPFLRVNRSEEEASGAGPVIPVDLERQLKRHVWYLILLEGEMIGAMSYQVDPSHLHRLVPGTAWPSIVIGEGTWRGKGIGQQAMAFLETEIRQAGLKRIELGVFAFNAPAIRLYQRLGYREIGRIKDFTYWRGRLRDDIRMEKLLP